jgi:DNA-binding transcriptional ArsR family regulator
MVDDAKRAPRRLTRRCAEGLAVAAWAMILKRVLQYQPLDLAFQALSDPTRRRMVERLSAGPATVSELAEPLPMSMSAVMQHLKILEASGLVATEKVGRVRTCRVEPRALGAAERWINDRRRSVERGLDRLGAYLDETRPEEETSK